MINKLNKKVISSVVISALIIGGTWIYTNQRNKIADQEQLSSFLIKDTLGKIKDVALTALGKTIRTTPSSLVAEAPEVLSKILKLKVKDLRLDEIVSPSPTPIVEETLIPTPLPTPIIKYIVITPTPTPIPTPIATPYIDYQAQLKEQEKLTCIKDEIDYLQSVYKPKLNSIKTKIQSIKDKYYSDVENLRNRAKNGAFIKSAYNNELYNLTQNAQFQIAKLTNDYNKLVNEFDSKIQAVDNQCSDWLD